LADFNIKEGDTLLLREWDPQKKEYTGRELNKKVTYLLNFELDKFGQKKEIEKKGLFVIQIE